MVFLFIMSTDSDLNQDIKQAQLFEAGQKVQLELPELQYGPVRTPIGQIQSILRNAETVEASLIGEIAVSARTKEPIYLLPSGERIVVTPRRTVKRPQEADGLILNDGNHVSWLSHAAIDDIESAASKKGWPHTIEQWAQRSAGKFSFRTEEPNPDGTVDEEKRGLRPPQIGALHAVGSHWSLYEQPATIVMPTGTGKTETMLSVLTSFSHIPMLVIVPSDALRSQTANKFLKLGLLRWLKVLDEHTPNPIVGNNHESAQD